MDYDVCAEGEALPGWLNASTDLVGEGGRMRGFLRENAAASVSA